MANIKKNIPRTVGEFKHYILHRGKPTIGYGSEFEQFYTLNSNNICDEFRKSIFWQECLKQFAEIDTQYSSNYNGLDLLLMAPEDILLNVKPISSVVEKAYRMGILENKAHFDSEDYDKKVVLPENLFGKMKDIIRTEVVVKYIDGIDLVIDAIKKLAKKHKHRSGKRILSKEEGYYAVHLYIFYKTRISDVENNVKDIYFPIEIQVRTQLQATIKSILHKYYEKDRLANDKRKFNNTWRWEFKKPRFIVNYIGHTLHFFDGLIVKVKDDKEG